MMLNAKQLLPLPASRTVLQMSHDESCMNMEWAEPSSLQLARPVSAKWKLAVFEERTLDKLN